MYVGGYTRPEQECSAVRPSPPASDYSSALRKTTAALGIGFMYRRLVVGGVLSFVFIFSCFVFLSTDNDSVNQVRCSLNLAIRTKRWRQSYFVCWIFVKFYVTLWVSNNSLVRRWGRPIKAFLFWLLYLRLAPAAPGWKASLRRTREF